MCDCVASALLLVSGVGLSRFAISECNSRSMRRPSCEIRKLYYSGSGSIRVGFGRNLNAGRRQGGLGFDEFEFEEGAGVNDGLVGGDLILGREGDELGSEKWRLDGGEVDDGFKEVSEAINELASAGVEFLERNGDGSKLKTGRRRKKGNVKKIDLVRREEVESGEVDGIFKLEGRERSLRSGRNVLKRSNLLAKQVISMQSALSLGFVSQLWVDASTWVVQVVEVRASLLSGESERFLLEDVFRVGDVVLVRDESVMDGETRLLGLETLVRGYSFDINSGVVESLELDSFGISIIPSSLVSTYVLLVEDVLEVLPDKVVVHEAAASRIQRLTKGIWGTKSVRTVNGVYSDTGIDSDEMSLPPEQARISRKRSSRNQYNPETRQKEEDDWELPIDYL
uniref:Uncharacterized protein n=1 Tax=Kalanchoe fedtschenkoi TaxID=63787 RepID=A0A7N0ZSH2_KALFE